MGALHVQRDAHFLGAPGGEGGVLAGPDGRDLEPHEPEAGLDVSMLWKRQMLMRPLRCTCSHMNMRSSPSMPGSKYSAGLMMKT